MNEGVANSRAEAQREFEKARNRRNIMIAWSLVAFMVLMFTITAVRLMQNMADRAEPVELTEVVDETVAAEQE